MIYYYLPQIGAISGGIKQIYRHIEILNSTGYNAKIFYGMLDRNNLWFDNGCPKENNLLAILSDDYIALPEISLQCVNKFLTRTKNIIIFNQNCYYTFVSTQYNLDKFKPIIYDFDIIKAFIVVSEDSRNYLNTCFPNNYIYRVFNGINDKLFYPQHKENIITFMPRKNNNHINQIINIISRNEILKGWKLIAVDNMTQSQVADIFNSSKIFLSTGCPEGCPLPPLEAIFSGNVVVGYTGVGGKEYFDKQPTVISIEYNNIIEFVKMIIKYVEWYTNNSDELTSKLINSINYYKKTYSLENEKNSIINAWENIIKNNI